MIMTMRAETVLKGAEEQTKEVAVTVETLCRDDGTGHLIPMNQVGNKWKQFDAEFRNKRETASKQMQHI